MACFSAHVDGAPPKGFDRQREESTPVGWWRNDWGGGGGQPGECGADPGGRVAGATGSATEARLPASQWSWSRPRHGVRLFVRRRLASPGVKRSYFADGQPPLFVTVFPFPQVARSVPRWDGCPASPISGILWHPYYASVALPPGSVMNLGNREPPPSINTRMSPRSTSNDFALT